MVHKKFIESRGKTYGPYLYESYRENGRVKKRYIKSPKIKRAVVDSFIDKKRGVNKLLIVSVLVLCIGIFGVLFFNSDITSHVVLNVPGAYVSGENITGNLEINLKEGELLPLDSRIIISQGGRENIFALGYFVSTNSNGSFYVEGGNISGGGEGYGFAGKKIVYSDVYFTLLLASGDTNISDVSGGGGDGAIEVIQTETPVETPTETPVETPTETPVETPTETPTEIVPESAQEVSSPAPETGIITGEVVGVEGRGFFSWLSSLFSGRVTGRIILDGAREVGGKVSKNSSFEYALEGNNFYVKEGSVYSDTTNLSSSVLSFLESGDVLTVSTDYSEESEGFGESYIGSDQTTHTLNISLDSLGVAAQSGLLEVNLVYGDVVLASTSKEISVFNGTLILNETVLNETEINVTQISNETLIGERIVVGRPVRWLKKVQIDETNRDNLQIEIPKEAENISVRTGNEIVQAEKSFENEDKQIENKQSILTGNVISGSSAGTGNGNGILSRIWGWLTGFSLTGKVISEEALGGSITETADSKIVDVSNVATSSDLEIAVEYITPAPTASEELMKNGKRIIVSAADELNYTDVLAYADLDNRVPINSSRIRVYWKASYEDAARYGYVSGGENFSNISAEVLVNESAVNETVGNESIVKNTTNETVGNESVVESVSNESSNESVVNETVSNENLVSENATEENSSDVDSGIMTGNVALEVNGGVDNNINESSNESVVESAVSNASKIYSIEVNYTAYDLDNDTMIDYIEWNVPHLSNQTYEIIYITKAEHLDENYTLVEDVYDSVKAIDGNYTTINDSHYLRVTFEQNLTNKKDITIYARDKCNGTILLNGTEVPCEIYEKKKRIDEIRREIGN